MTIHSHITNIHSFTILLLFVLFVGYAQSASAQEIDVDYGGGPLFSEADFLPGDTVERSFMVENLSDVEQEVRLRTLDESDTGLAEVVQVDIERAGGILYFEDTLEQLFGEDYVSLGMVNPGATVEFTMGATFLPDSGNGYQGGTAGFAVCVGFAGENENCVTDTEPGGYAQGSYGGGGGGGGQQISLVNGVSTSNGSDETDNGPTPQIAGESTSIWPLGAPNTGFGMLLQDEAVRVKFFAALLILMIIGGLVYTRKKLEVW